jgi:hypothetical protein
MSIVIQPSRPAEPSSVLLELERTTQAAGAAYHTALDEFEADCKRRNSVPSDVAGVFRDTEEGKALADAYDGAYRQYQAARRFTESIDLGGVVVKMREVRPEAREAVYRAAAEHGIDTVRWPRELLDEISLLLKKERVVTPSELATMRRRALEDEAQASLDRLRAEHGDNPTTWPVKALDEVALHRARVAVFNDLAGQAGLDVHWRPGKAA